MLDPETIAAQYLKPEDQAIKEKDFPERLQLAGIDNRAEVRVAGGVRRGYLWIVMCGWLFVDGREALAACG